MVDRRLKPEEGASEEFSLAKEKREKFANLREQQRRGQIWGRRLFRTRAVIYSVGLSRLLAYLLVCWGAVEEGRFSYCVRSRSNDYSVTGRQGPRDLVLVFLPATSRQGALEALQASNFLIPRG